MCGTDCAASTSTTAPAACARGTIVVERRDRADRVRDVRERDQLHAGEQRVEVVEHQHAVAVGRDVAQLGAGLGGQQLPRHEVGVVLELGGEDRVARSEVRQTPRERDQVDRLGRVARPDDLFGVRRVHETRDLRARRFEVLGRTRGQFVDAAVDVGVVVLVVVNERIDDRPRLLRGRRRVEVDQPLAARRPLAQDREVGDDLRLFGVGGGDHAPSSVASSILRSSAVRISSRSDSPGKREMTGSKKPSVMRRSASPRAIPRLPA